MVLLDEIKIIVPPLSYEAHKGQFGRIAVVGGSSIYTGAPYFAAISALKTGCDLAHVFCTSDAAPVIKSYSPEIMVHPFLSDKYFIEKISERLPSLHSIVIGPGLGRDSTLFDNVGKLINEIKDRNLPVILDADAIYFIKNNPDIIHSYKNALLTPNKREFIQLYNGVTKEKLDNKTSITQEHVKELAEQMGNVTILKKGKVDIISDGTDVATCDEMGSPRRCGGQGDLLCGMLATFRHWADMCCGDKSSLKYSSSVIASVAACFLVKRCNALAFQKYKRNMIVTDMLGEIPSAFSSLFD